MQQCWSGQVIRNRAARVWPGKVQRPTCKNGTPRTTVKAEKTPTRFTEPTIPVPVDYYKLLGVARTTSRDAVKRSYEKLVNTVPPMFSQDTLFSRAVLLKTAEECLGNPELRYSYDQKLSSGFDELRISNVDLPGALVLLQETGQSDLVVQLASDWLERHPAAPDAGDVCTCLALSHLDRAGKALSKHSNRVSEAFESMDSALQLMSKNNVSPHLQEKLVVSMQNLLPKYVFEQLSQFKGPQHAGRRHICVQLFLNYLRAEIDEKGKESVEEKLRDVRSAMTAAEQVAFYNDLPKELRRSPIEQYDRAMALLSYGFVNGWPHYVLKADKVFKKLQDTPGVLKAGDADVDLAVERAVCAVLLCDMRTAQNSLGLTADSSKPCNPSIKVFVQAQTSSPGQTSTGVLRLVCRWLGEVALANYHDTANMMVTTEALAVWAELPQLKFYSKALRLQALGAPGQWLLEACHRIALAVAALYAAGRVVVEKVVAVAIGLMTAAGAVAARKQGAQTEGDGKNAVDGTAPSSQTAPPPPPSQSYAVGMVSLPRSSSLPRRGARVNLPALQPRPRVNEAAEGPILPLEAVRRNHSDITVKELKTRLSQALGQTEQPLASASEVDWQAEPAVNCASTLSGRGAVGWSGHAVSQLLSTPERLGVGGGGADAAALRQLEAVMWDSPDATAKEAWTKWRGVAVAAVGVLCCLALGSLLLRSQRGARSAAPAAATTTFTTTQVSGTGRSTKAATTSTSLLTRSEAEALLRRWMAAKASALGADHDTAALHAVLHPPMLDKWLGLAAKAEQNKWHWEYQVLGMRVSDPQPVAGAADSNPKALPRVTVQAQLFEQGRMVQDGAAGDSFKTKYAVQYTLERSSGSWMIVDSDVVGPKSGNVDS